MWRSVEKVILRHRTKICIAFKINGLIKSNFNTKKSYLYYKDAPETYYTWRLFLEDLDYLRLHQG